MRYAISFTNKFNSFIVHLYFGAKPSEELLIDFFGKMGFSFEKGKAEITVWEDPIDPDPTFQKDLAHIINKYSKENGSNTPDFILATYLSDCLAVFNKAVSARTKWNSPESLSLSKTTVTPAPPYEENDGGRV